MGGGDGKRKKSARKGGKAGDDKPAGQSFGSFKDLLRSQGGEPESSSPDEPEQDRGWTLEVAIPFNLFENVLPQGHPNPGDRWRLNLSRLEDEMRSKSQWSQGDRNFPRFHHPEYFGTVEFHPDAPQVMTDEE